MRTTSTCPLKSSILVSLMTICFNFTFGQTEIKKRQSIYFELAGSGGLGSFNYEKLFRSKKKIDFTWRVGLSLAPIDKNNGTGIIFPVMVNGIVGKKSHKLELGVGQGLTITTKGSVFALTTAVLGYRYQPMTQKWFYRLSYTPLVSYLVDFQIQHWAGFSIGRNLSQATK